MAADMLTHFDTYWKKAENEPEEQHRLMHLIFERIWVKENAVVTVCLRPNYHVTVYRTGNPFDTAVAQMPNEITIQRALLSTHALLLHFSRLLGHSIALFPQSQTRSSHFRFEGAHGLGFFLEFP